jgi:hypothetical protein
MSGMTGFFSLQKQVFSLLRVRLPRHLKTPVLISFLISSIIALLVLVLYFSLQPVVPLFYSLAQPADYLVPKMWLIVFPIISFAITLVHLASLNSLRMYETIIQKLYIWMTVAIQCLLLLALVRILWIIV